MSIISVNLFHLSAVNNNFMLTRILYVGAVKVIDTNSEAFGSRDRLTEQQHLIVPVFGYLHKNAIFNEYTLIIRKEVYNLL